MKFSIIIPVYNVEKYLKRCIDSVLNQTYNNYEIIIINDGSTDNSSKILESYKNPKIKIINQENNGVSYSRNVGVSNSTGDYILFLDSDDFYETKLLETLNEEIQNEEMIKFNYNDFKENTKIPMKNIEFKSEQGKDILKRLIEEKINFETPWIFAIKKDYMLNYKFEIDKYHEDFGLMPIMVYNSKNISSINFIGYNYNRENENSITAYKNQEKEYKKALDTLYFFKKVKETNIDKYILSFYANGVLQRINNLRDDYKKRYIQEIKKEKVYNYILDNNLKRKIKKNLLKIYFLFK